MLLNKIMEKSSNNKPYISLSLSYAVFTLKHLLFMSIKFLLFSKAFFIEVLMIISVYTCDRFT